MRIATESPLPHHQALKAKFEEAKARGSSGSGGRAPPAGSDDGEDMVALNERLKRATVELQQNKAAIAAMERDKMAGSLMAREDVDFVVADFGGTLRGLLENLPDRLAGEIASHGGNVNAIHKSIEDAAREILVALSEQMERRMKELGG